MYVSNFNFLKEINVCLVPGTAGCEEGFTHPVWWVLFGGVVIQGQFRDYIKNIEIKVRLWNEDNIPPCRGRSGGEGGGVAGPMGRLCWKMGRKCIENVSIFCWSKNLQIGGAFGKGWIILKKKFCRVGMLCIANIVDWVMWRRTTNERGGERGGRERAGLGWTEWNQLGGGVGWTEGGW